MTKLEQLKKNIEEDEEIKTPHTYEVAICLAHIDKLINNN